MKPLADLLIVLTARRNIACAVLLLLKAVKGRRLIPLMLNLLKSVRLPPVSRLLAMNDLDIVFCYELSHIFILLKFLNFISSIFKILLIFC